MEKFKDDESLMAFIKGSVLAPIFVGTAGATLMLVLVAIVQFLVQGEVTLFTNNFWSKSAVS